MRAKDISFSPDALNQLRKLRAQTGGAVFSHEQAARDAKERGTAAPPPCHPLLDPFYKAVRECLRNGQFPHALGVLFSLDLTGTMQRLVEEFEARLEKVPTTVRGLNIFEHPQFCILGFGNVNSDEAPIQMGHFEPDLEFYKQVCLLNRAAAMGCDRYESSETAAYMAAYHTRQDAWNDGEKGYNFFVTDEPPYPYVDMDKIRQFVCKAPSDQRSRIPTAEVFATHNRLYHGFCMVPNQGAQGSNDPGLVQEWSRYLPHRVIRFYPEQLCGTAVMLMGLNEGTFGLTEGLKLLKGQDFDARAIDQIGEATEAFAAYMAQQQKASTDGPLPAVAEKQRRTRRT